MSFSRNPWFDVGLGLAGLTGLVLLIAQISPISLSFLLWLSWATLCLHQVEEYRYPGYFPGVLHQLLSVVISLAVIYLTRKGH